MAYQKVTSTVVDTMHTMFNNGINQSIIAQSFRVSLSTVQNVKKTGWNYNNYKELVRKQFNEMHKRTENSFKSDNGNYTRKQTQDLSTVDNYELLRRTIIVMNTLCSKIDHLTLTLNNLHEEAI